MLVSSTEVFPQNLSLSRSTIYTNIHDHARFLSCHRHATVMSVTFRLDI